MNTQRNWVEVGSGGGMHDFKVNPEIEGKYVKIEENQGPKKNSNIYTLETEEGEEVKFWGGTVIDGRFEEIALGEYVKVVFKGKAKSKTGTEYNAFDVLKDEPVVDVDDVNSEI